MRVAMLLLFGLGVGWALSWWVHTAPDHHHVVDSAPVTPPSRGEPGYLESRAAPEAVSREVFAPETEQEQETVEQEAEEPETSVAEDSRPPPQHWYRLKSADGLVDHKHLNPKGIELTEAEFRELAQIFDEVRREHFLVESDLTRATNAAAKEKIASGDYQLVQLGQKPVIGRKVKGESFSISYTRGDEGQKFVRLIPGENVELDQARDGVSFVRATGTEIIRSFFQSVSNGERNDND